MGVVFLVEKHYEIAENNGISRSQLDDYFYEKGRSFQDIVKNLDEGEEEIVKNIKQEPEAFRHIWERWKDRAVVSRDTMYQRHRKGMGEKEAALKPVWGNRIIWTDAEKEKAKKAGVYCERMRTPYFRHVKHGWTREAAVSFPKRRVGSTLSKKERKIALGIKGGAEV